MAITRVTQRMLSQRSLSAVQGGLNRMAKVQEQLETGKKFLFSTFDPSTLSEQITTVVIEGREQLHQLGCSSARQQREHRWLDGAHPRQP